MLLKGICIKTSFRSWYVKMNYLIEFDTIRNNENYDKQFFFKMR